jgi:lipopolysaccharide transport system ATP-binding protein
MNNTVIRVENLGKRYRIGERESYKALRDVLSDGFAFPWRVAKDILTGQQNRKKSSNNTLWALQELSFDVKQGEVVGIIGRNGAGKSTLLKILSRITKPTVGHAKIFGRVGSLLEVGTGFHPELTGRENIYLNGAILGMRRLEIERKFDEIVAFAEVERFLDTPVKRYSSGMYVRLAFAVAAHLEPEILVVDEVLAVGDAAFQKKCLGKMGDVADEGRTVLFVSHNMAAVQSLCGRALWLHDGQLLESGPPSQVVSNYLQSSAVDTTEQRWNDITTAPGNDKVRLHRVRVRPEGGLPSEPITMQSPFVIEVEFWNLVPDAMLDVTLHLFTEQGIIAFGSSTGKEKKWGGRPFPKGLFRSTCHIPGDLLNSGMQRIRLLIVRDEGTILHRHEDILSFEVLDATERRGAWYGKRVGAVRPLLEWKTEYID